MAKRYQLRIEYTLPPPTTGEIQTTYGHVSSSAWFDVRHQMNNGKGIEIEFENGASVVYGESLARNMFIEATPDDVVESEAKEG